MLTWTSSVLQNLQFTALLVFRVLNGQQEFVQYINLQTVYLKTLTSFEQRNFGPQQPHLNSLNYYFCGVYGRASDESRHPNEVSLKEAIMQAFQEMDREGMNILDSGPER